MYLSLFSIHYRIWNSFPNPILLVRVQPIFTQKDVVIVWFSRIQTQFVFPDPSARRSQNYFFIIVFGHTICCSCAVPCDRFHSQESGRPVALEVNVEFIRVLSWRLARGRMLQLRAIFGRQLFPTTIIWELLFCVLTILNLPRALFWIHCRIWNAHIRFWQLQHNIAWRRKHQNHQNVIPTDISSLLVVGMIVFSVSLTLHWI